ncbi:hypothetical protein F4824DRAFT_326652 [Ustulina deusta]|nr:hypothetical protein F4823DRAFT_549077 [Ustulina deusta]KAI3330885.1 hypothetical protein F4824DRAFT_326652 [Ustulina deusta]
MRPPECSALVYPSSLGSPPGQSPSPPSIFFSHLHIHTQTRKPNQHHRCPSAFCVSCSCFILLLHTLTQPNSHLVPFSLLFSPSRLRPSSPISRVTFPSTHPLPSVLSVARAVSRAPFRTQVWLYFVCACAANSVFHPSIVASLPRQKIHPAFLVITF